MADFRPYGTDKDFDKLVNNKDWNVRKAVAEASYGLDRLVDDENCWVRAEVARQGYGLDKLVDDETYVVRSAVAEQGYGLDRLITDIIRDIQATVKEYLADNKYKNIKEWAKDNPDKTYYKNEKNKDKER